MSKPSRLPLNFKNKAKTKIALFIPTGAQKSLTKFGLIILIAQILIFSFLYFSTQPEEVCASPGCTGTCTCAGSSLVQCGKCGRGGCYWDPDLSKCFGTCDCSIIGDAWCTDCTGCSLTGTTTVSSTSTSTSTTSTSSTSTSSTSTSTSTTSTSTTTTIPVNYIEVNGTSFTQWVNKPDGINITAWSDVVSDTTYLFDNLTQIQSGTGTIENITSAKTWSLGYHNVSANSTNNATLEWKTFQVLSPSYSGAYPVAYEDVYGSPYLIRVNSSDNTYANLTEDTDTWMYVNFSKNLVCEDLKDANLIVEHYEDGDDIILEIEMNAWNGTGWIKIGDPTPSTSEINHTVNLYDLGIDTPDELNGIGIRWNASRSAGPSDQTFVDYFMLNYSYTPPTGCDYCVFEIPYTISESGKTYCLVDDVSTSTGLYGVNFTGSAIYNSTLDCRNQEMDGWLGYDTYTNFTPFTTNAISIVNASKIGVINPVIWIRRFRVYNGTTDVALTDNGGSATCSDDTDCNYAIDDNTSTKWIGTAPYWLNITFDDEYLITEIFPDWKYPVGSHNVSVFYNNSGTWTAIENITDITVPSAFQTARDTYGIEIREGYNNTIQNCTIKDFYWGIYFRDGYNHTIKDSNITRNVYGIFLFNINETTVKNNLIYDNQDGKSPVGSGIAIRTLSYYNIFFNNSIYDNYNGIEVALTTGPDNYANPNYNNFTSGTIHSNSNYDYGAIDKTNYFINNNFTASRKIHFQRTRKSVDIDNYTYFNYQNESGGIWLNTTVTLGTITTITRLLSNLNQTLIKWNDTGTVTAYYNMSGLLSSTDYEIYNNSVLVSTLTTDSSGTLPQFSIDLSGEHEIKVEKSDCTPSSGEIDCSKKCEKKNKKEDIKPKKIRFYNDGFFYANNYDLASNGIEFYVNATDCKIIFKDSTWVI